MLAACCVCELIMTLVQSDRGGGGGGGGEKKEAHYLTITTHLLSQWLQPIPSVILKTHGGTHTHTHTHTHTQGHTVFQWHHQCHHGNQLSWHHHLVAVSITPGLSLENRVYGCCLSC